MKRIRTIFGAAAVASLLCFSFSVNAQENSRIARVSYQENAEENNNRDADGKVVRGPYLTNRAGDNWFIGIGGGLNTVYDGDVDFKAMGGLATDLFVGKWFTPSVGARFGWRGLKNSFDSKSTLTSQFSDEKFNQNFIHGDLLWNISNAFGGYKETRTWEFIPYAQFGYLLASNYPKVKGMDYVKDQEFGAGAGLLNDIRLGKCVDLFVDLSAMVTRDAILGDHSRSHRFGLLPSVTAGLVFNLGRKNFDRYSSVAPVIVPLPFTEADYNGLKSKVAEQEKENAALRNKISELESRGPETVYVEKTVESPLSLLFDIDKATLNKRELSHLAIYAKDNLTPDSKIVITGAADSATGSPAYNLKLSAKRAEYVKNLLVKKFGLSAENITTEALGGIAKYDTPAENRVAIVK